MLIQSEGGARVCHGPCDQGRRSCPCPNACETPEAEFARIEQSCKKTAYYLGFALLCLLLAGIWIGPHL